MWQSIKAKLSALWQRIKTWGGGPGPKTPV